MIISAIFVIGLMVWLVGGKSSFQSQHYTATATGTAEIKATDNLVPGTYAHILNLLHEQYRQIDTAIQEAIGYRQRASGQRDQAKYQKVLANGMDICIKAYNALHTIEIPSELTSCVSLTLKYIEQVHSGLSSWYNGLSGNTEAIKRGDQLINTAIEIRRQYLTELENFLKAHGYRYEKTANGIKYYYAQ